MKNRYILFLSNFGPERNGLTVFNNMVVAMFNDIYFKCIEVSRYNAIKSIIYIPLYRLYTKSSYLTISDNNMGFLRDLFILCLLKIFGFKITAHSHSGKINLHIKGIKKMFYNILLDNLIILDESTRPRNLTNVSIHILGNIPSKVFYQNRDNLVRENKICFAGNLSTEKGLFIALQAFHMFSRMEPNWYIEFIGKFNKDCVKSKFWQIVKNNGMEDKVIVNYYSDPVEMRSTLESSKIFLFPTFYKTEGFPLVILEAIFSGLYVIATKWRSIPSMLNGIPSSLILARPDKYPEEAIFEIFNELDKLRYKSIDPNDIRRLAQEKFDERAFKDKLASII